MGRIVCFDIGGVLVKIRHTWDAAVLASKLETQPHHGAALNSFNALLNYQDGTIPEDEYIVDLADWLNISNEEAAIVHRSILDRDYPGASELVTELKAVGVFTSCFSNTNALHWKLLTDPTVHPAVASLDLKIASHELNAAKPSVDAFERVEKMFPGHESVVFFDDTLENVDAANEFGWDAHQIDPSGDPVAQMRTILAQNQVLTAAAAQNPAGTLPS